MFSVLPSMLQNKLTRIPSIRKTVSTGSIKHIKHVFSSGTSIDLITNASRESRCGMSAGYSSPFERAAYVDGVSYMLRGLPRDLDETELTVLRRSMPEPLADALPGSSKPRGHTRRPLREGNFVHNFLFNILMFLHVWICWATPHALYLAGTLMRFERTNKITEHVLAAVVAAVNALRQIGDGIAGQVISDVCEYTTQGISAALKEFAQEKSEPRKGR
ncbi:hypothetical protein B0H67DRAFT_645453 [Lasiosphaeris hirsuta]|uniref:Uncharacterized protein n=1 Tax=Lasiosphaeris hirsuta TaxID=260670 RepID=A0AA40AH32_9PEZI|nr:hypothetical protein B0H67DRAFT_645453 [Lasiosphaeris hirsuta]